MLLATKYRLLEVPSNSKHVADSGKLEFPAWSVPLLTCTSKQHLPLGTGWMDLYCESACRPFKPLHL